MMRLTATSDSLTHERIKIDVDLKHKTLLQGMMIRQFT